MKKRCVILGSSGFIGKHLALALKKEGYEVIGIQRNYDDHLKREGVPQCKIDIIKQTSLLNDILQEDDVVFDLVSPSVPSTSTHDNNKEIEHHVLPHLSLFEIACQKKVKKIVFFSSGGGVYGEQSNLPIAETSIPMPISPYAISKLSLEYYLNYITRQYNTSHLIYRVGNPYGPGQSCKESFGIIPHMFGHIKEGTRPVLYNNGNNVRDFIYISDLIEAVLTSFNAQTQKNIYNIASGKGIVIKNLWEVIQHVTQVKIEPIYKEKRQGDVEKVYLDITALSNEFHWSPEVSLKQGIMKTWQWND